MEASEGISSGKKWWDDKEALEAVQQLVYVEGVLLKPPNSSPPSVTNISVTLEPSLFPEKLFEAVLDLQTEFNTLIDSVSRDHEFLIQTFEKLADVDEYIRGLLHIYKTVTKAGYKERSTLGLHRMDYMLDYKFDKLNIKQVELNTMAVCLGPHAERLKAVHDYVTSRYTSKPANSIFPDSHCLASLCNGIFAAWKAYNNTNSQVLFVTLKDESTIFDQRVMEYRLWKEYGIKSMRRSLRQISEQGRLDDDRQLFIGDVEIAVVYYRSSYSPSHFPTHKEWDARMMCEMSCASNCPNLPYFLVGFKKVQQLLALPEVLGKYCKDVKVIERMRQVFAGLHSLDLNTEGDESAKLAISSPDSFVMKPQREGGGNNIYGNDIKTLLLELGSSKEREEYILMERIRPPAVPGVIWWQGGGTATNEEVSCIPVINELGIFGAYVRVDNNVVLNIPAGHFIKTKSPSVDEGGVSHGAAALDMPLLIPDNQYIQYFQRTNSV